MRLHRTGSLVIATAALGASAPTAHADTPYGGMAVIRNQPWTPSISMVRRDDGRIVARAAFAYRCRGIANSALIVRLSGTTDGTNFSASGRSSVPGVGRLRLTLQGTLSPDAATGKVRMRWGRCAHYTRTFVLKAEAPLPPAFAPPTPGTILHGVTGQAASGVRLPVTLRVAKNGRVYAIWQATMKCGRVTWPMLDVTPTRAVKADGTFGGSQTYTIRYRRHSERYRVTFRGQFVAGGATGTLRARMQLRDGRRRYVPCVSGTQTWSARP